MRFGIKHSQIIKDWNLRVRGFLKTDLAPILVFKDGKIQIREMCFSLCPSWSKEFPCQWSTYNARMERPHEKDKRRSQYIYEIATWRDSFSKGYTCLVPMNGAIESSYFGSQAGNIINLHVKGDEIFYVCGLWSEWVDQMTGEIKETFTLITDDPYQFFFDCGHDRSIFVIDPKTSVEWLQNRSFTPIERFDFLRKNRVSLNWDVRVDREMAKGWQKRKPSDQELGQIKIWQS